jgi:outer membrane protein assembly factor BamB/plastocyanin/cytochrome c5
MTSSTIKARIAVIAACATGSVGLGAQAIASPHAASHEWASVHGGPANQRYVALDQINRDTVAKLGAVWVSEPFADGASSRMTPLVHDGLMFFAAGPRIYALDAQSGKVVWAHETDHRTVTSGKVFHGADETAELQASGASITRSFGLGLGSGMVFASMMNGHVMAFNEKTGALVWDQLFSDEPLAIAQGIVCVPLYVNGVLYFGFGHEFVGGHVVAVDAKSGRLLWKTSTIPGPGEPGHETWPQDSEIWRQGDADPWAAGAADASLGMVYFVTANAGPPGGGKIRPGDNLYSVSLIALEMKTGKLRWYHQLIHHDVWEADLSMPPVLFEIKQGGRLRKGIGVMRGDGYLFLFDRGSGEPLVPIDERPVPQDRVLFTAATQPFPRDADSILPPCESWKAKIPAGFVLGCMFDPPSHEVLNRLAQGPTVRLAAMSFDPQTGYFYAQGSNSLFWQGDPSDPYVWITNLNGTRVPGYPRTTAVVAAIDSRTDKVVWRKELPAYDDSGYKGNGGSLSTASGLVFHQGGDGTLQAYDARTGETLWRFQTDFATGDGPPISYAIGGKQYVAFIAGPKVWAFALGGTLPQAAPIPAPPHEEVSGPIEDKNEIETLTLEPAFGHGHRYHLNEYAFNPYRARVRAGTRVKFINNGYLPHTIMARDGSWSTGTLIPAQVGVVRFDKPGSYVYISKEYPWSYGEIIVVPAGENPMASDQVNLGKTTYAASCAACHGDNLSGREPAPALAGSGFSARWSGRDALALFDRIRTTMPQGAPNSLSEESYAALVAYILQSNDHPFKGTLDPQSMKGLGINPTR